MPVPLGDRFHQCLRCAAGIKRRVSRELLDSVCHPRGILGFDGDAAPIDLDRKIAAGRRTGDDGAPRSEEHTSELQSLMRISYAVFCLKKKNKNNTKKRTI